MLLTLGDVLCADKLAAVAKDIDRLPWVDGRKTAGADAHWVKQNTQADLSGTRGRNLAETLTRALRDHPVLQAAALPRRFSRLMISRTENGGHYGPHVDNAIMGSSQAIRSDLAFTLFLSEGFTGGELTVHLHGATQSVAARAGDAVLYPASTIHEVTPVEEGARIVCVGWIESRVRDAGAREILFDLQNLRAELRGRSERAAELLVLNKCIANLLRRWADA